MPPGVYTVKATLAGFKEATRADVRLAINSQVVAPFTLEVGGLRGDDHRHRAGAARRHDRERRAHAGRHAADCRAAAEVARLPRPHPARARRRQRSGLGVGRPDRLDLVRRHERELQVDLARGRGLQRRGHRRRQLAVVGDAHRAGPGGHPGVPGDGQLLLRRVRPVGLGRHQHPHQVGRQPAARQRLLLPPRRRLRPAELLLRDGAAVQDRAVRRYRRRPDRPEPALLLRLVGEARQRALGPGEHPAVASATT